MIEASSAQQTTTQQMTQAALSAKAQTALVQSRQHLNSAAIESPDNQRKVEEAAKEFEAVFIAQLLKPMFDEIKVDPTFGGGKGEEIFSDMMLQEYGKIIADRGGLGFTQPVKAEMLRIQEEMNNAK